jgi:hypothetical protein
VWRAKRVPQFTLERFEALARVFGLNVRSVVDDNGFSAEMGEGPGGPGRYSEDAVLSYRSGDDCLSIRGGYPIQRREAAFYLVIYTHNRTADAEHLRRLLTQTMRQLRRSSHGNGNPPKPEPERNPCGRRRVPWSGRLTRFFY